MLLIIGMLPKYLMPGHDQHCCGRQHCPQCPECSKGLRSLFLLDLLHVSHAAGVAERLGPVRTGTPDRGDLQQMRACHQKDATMKTG